MKWFFKKEKGLAGTMDFLPMILLVVLGAYVLINCSLHMRYLDTLNRLENISRKYLLIMETTNGLTTTDLDGLYQELSEIGIQPSDVDFGGTTFWDSNVEYGEEIYLNIRAMVPYNVLSFSGNFQTDKVKSKKEVNIHKCALALS